MLSHVIDSEASDSLRGTYQLGVCMCSVAAYCQQASPDSYHRVVLCPGMGLGLTSGVVEQGQLPLPALYNSYQQTFTLLCAYTNLV